MVLSCDLSGYISSNHIFCVIKLWLDFNGVIHVKLFIDVKYYRAEVAN